MFCTEYHKPVYINDILYRFIYSIYLHMYETVDHGEEVSPRML